MNKLSAYNYLDASGKKLSVLSFKSKYYLLLHLLTYLKTRITRQRSPRASEATCSF